MQLANIKKEAEFIDFARHKYTTFSKMVRWLPLESNPDVRFKAIFIDGRCQILLMRISSVRLIIHSFILSFSFSLVFLSFNICDQCQ